MAMPLCDQLVDHHLAGLFLFAVEIIAVEADIQDVVHVREAIQRPLARLLPQAAPPPGHAGPSGHTQPALRFPGSDFLPGGGKPRRKRFPSIG